MFATRFEWNCRTLAKVIAIRQDPRILLAPTEDQKKFFENLEGTLAKQIRKIVPQFTELPEVSHDEIVTRARRARNDIAHEVGSIQR